MNLKLLHQFTTRALLIYQSLFNIPTLGARAIVLNAQNQILLVKHTYQPHWYIPGGGIENNESPKAAVIRELFEEVGVKVMGDPELLGVYHHRYKGVSDYPIVYVVKNYAIEPANSPEIAAMDWFDYANLPESTSPGTRRRLDEYFNQTKPSDIW